MHLLVWAVCLSFWHSASGKKHAPIWVWGKGTKYGFEDVWRLFSVCLYLCWKYFTSLSSKTRPIEGDDVSLSSALLKRSTGDFIHSFPSDKLCMSVKKKIKLFIEMSDCHLSCSGFQLSRIWGFVFLIPWVNHLSQTKIFRGDVFFFFCSLEHWIWRTSLKITFLLNHMYYVIKSLHSDVSN